jgi:hypothetical protein
MASPFSTVEVVNSALQFIAAQTKITSLSDGSPAATAAQVVYQPVVQLLLRELDPDFARVTAALVSAGASTPIVPWAFEYTYPADCVRLRQVRPPSGTYNINDPQVVRANVAFDTTVGSGTKVILTNLANALAVYTSSTPTEAVWDSVFAEAVSRRLANPLAMALSGRPDFASEVLEQAARVAMTAETVDESSVRRLM